MTLDTRLRQVLAIDPAAPAVEFDESWTTWGELDRTRAALEQALDRDGLGEGAAVGLVLRNRPQMVAALIGVLAARRCAVSISPFQGARSLRDDLSGLRLPVVAATSEDWASPALVEAVRAAGSVGIELTDRPEQPLRRVPEFEGLAGDGRRGATPAVAIEMLTSGTTGAPKRVRITAAALEQALAGSSHYESPRSEPRARLRRGVAILASPLVHIGGTFFAVKSAVDGRPFCLLDRFSVDAWRDAVVRHRPRVVGLVPSALKMLLDANVPLEDLSSLRAITTGTAPLSPELQTEVEQRYGIPVLSTYGATEFAGAVAGWTLADHESFAATHRGSVGRAHPGCELRIVDSDSGEALQTGKVGLLEIRSAQSGRRGWVRTTDLARMDEDGFLWIEGRADGAINRGGFKIDPEAVARALELHPDIREAAVVGLPDARLGEVPVAAVEARSDAPPPSEGELIAFAREHLSAYHVPTRVRVVDAIPRTPSLKPRNDALRALFEEPASPQT